VVSFLSAKDGTPTGQRYENPPISCMALSPKGTHLACGCENWLAIWDLAKDQNEPGQVFELATQTIHSVAFSSDGTRLACTTGGYSYGPAEVKVFEVKSSDSAGGGWNNVTEGPAALTIRGHDAEVFDMVYTGDGHRLITASDDQTLRLWEAKTGREVLTLRGHTGGLTAVAVSADQRRIASAGRDNRILIWDANPLRPASPPK
jgi:WD40 repeat protein